MNEPFGTTTISGQTSHSLKLSFGMSDASISGVSGWTRFSGKICRGARGGGDWLSSAIGTGVATPGGHGFVADATSANETKSAPAINGRSSFDANFMNDPWRNGSVAAWSRAKEIAFKEKLRK
ncbi:hypothetical protein [Bradyrhizobium sp. OAE829]|uniref:hypothetical protein n=1 Tax=Bradyrhizobium sp. OAE829 TaxID=2663807 RepID=UPI003399403B